MENYINLENNKDLKKLIEPAKMIKAGKIVVFPTETVYGIGTNGLDENAIKKLYQIKRRPLNKPISLLVSNMDMIEKIAQNITETEYKLLKSFFPGPFTIILNKRSIIPDILTSGQNDVGIRMPDSEITKALIDYAGVPIATSSANISGKSSGTNIENIIDDFKDEVDFFIDSGKSKLGIASTVVKVINNTPHILREGTITLDEINKVLNK